jgi:hypothetical protein
LLPVNLKIISRLCNAYDLSISGSDSINAMAFLLFWDAVMRSWAVRGSNQIKGRNTKLPFNIKSSQHGRGGMGHMKALRSLADCELSISVGLESSWTDFCPPVYDKGQYFKLYALSKHQQTAS